MAWPVWCRRYLGKPFARTVCIARSNSSLALVRVSPHNAAIGRDRSRGGVARAVREEVGLGNLDAQGTLSCNNSVIAALFVAAGALSFGWRGAVSNTRGATLGGLPPRPNLRAAT